MIQDGDDDDNEEEEEEEEEEQEEEEEEEAEETGIEIAFWFHQKSCSFFFVQLEPQAFKSILLFALLRPPLVHIPVPLPSPMAGGTNMPV